MEMKLGFDTNIFIAIRNKEPNHLSCKKIIDMIQIDKNGEKKSSSYVGFLSTIVIAEMLVRFYKNREFEQAKDITNIIQQHYTVIPVNIEISIEAAKLRGKSGLKLPDALIAMSYHQMNVDYFISNDFEIAEKLSFIVIKPEDFISKILP